MGVRHGFLCGESLGSNQKEGSLGVHRLENFANVGSVDVGAKVHVQIAFRVWLEGLANHNRSEVGSTNTNIYNVCDRLSGVPLPFAGSDLLGEGLDATEDLVDLGHDVLSIHEDGGVGLVSKSDVQDGTTLGFVY